MAVPLFDPGCLIRKKMDDLRGELILNWDCRCRQRRRPLAVGTISAVICYLAERGMVSMWEHCRLLTKNRVMGRTLRIGRFSRIGSACRLWEKPRRSKRVTQICWRPAILRSDVYLSGARNLTIHRFILIFGLYQTRIKCLWLNKRRIRLGSVKYVTKVGRDGWLLVQMDTGEKISLPQFLKVEVLRTANNHDYFRILEGVYKGKTGSVSLKAQAPPQSYFSDQLRQTGPAVVRFAPDEQKLWFGHNQNPINAFTGHSPRKTPVPKGSYPLQIPFAPSHETRVGYYTWTDFHKTWFRLGLDPMGDRFLHVGEISHGCVTVRPFLPDVANLPEGFSDLAQVAGTPYEGEIGLPIPTGAPAAGSWTDLYNYLISSRADDQSVGTLLVL